MYKPIRKIGKGAFATVYHVRRLSDNKDFAVKAFSKSHVNSSNEARLTIQSEISILKDIEHDNLLALHEVYESSNSLYLVMEMYESVNFMDLIKKRNASFSLAEIASYMICLLKGLAFLDKNNIMHRDIKP
jgi:serine/threonine protein kinase